MAVRTPASEHHPSSEPKALTLASSTTAGLPEPLAGRVDEHLARFADHLREGLLAASSVLGLEVMAELMAAEVTELVGPKGRHDPDRTATRHGSDDGTVTLGGRRLPIRHPRVRSVGDDERELALESYPDLRGHRSAGRRDRGPHAGRAVPPHPARGALVPGGGIDAA